ncbi:MAG: class I SAM-dependent methyltransferase [Myxococcota bacterium]
MSEREQWDGHYADGFLPWDTGLPEPLLVELVQGGGVPVGRVLEIGCGTGTNAVWLAQHGYDVVAVDISPLAVARARERAASAGVGLDVRAVDFLNEPLGAGLFDLVFDRGCFHVFDAAVDQDRFAARVASLLAPGGRWLSLVGSTEGPPRNMGPPRRSARDLVVAIEPHLEILEIRSVVDSPGTGVRMWSCLSGRRVVGAQPSTLRRG